MFRTRSILIMSIVLVILFGPSVNALPSGPRPVAPVIFSTQVDLERNRMTIAGRHFGDSAPIVKLADQILEVQNASATEIVVKLPINIKPATYLLTVSSSAQTHLSGAFNTVIYSAAAE